MTEFTPKDQAKFNALALFKLREIRLKLLRLDIKGEMTSQERSDYETMEVLEKCILVVWRTFRTKDGLSNIE